MNYYFRRNTVPNALHWVTVIRVEKNNIISQEDYKVRKNLFKKATAAILSLTMVVGMTGIVSAAPVANGTNVANQNWTSFSVVTMEDHVDGEDGSKEHPWCWYHGTEEAQKENLKNNGDVYDPNKDMTSYTEGWLAAGSTSSNFDFWVNNSGWDGEYNKMTGELVTDNPWGLTVTMKDIPVELGRYYTISFKIKSTLNVTKKDENGKIVTDENGTPVKVTQKQINVKAYDPNSPGEPGIDYVSTSGINSAGYTTLDSKEDWKTVTAQIKIPNQGFGGNTIGIKFALGAFVKSLPEQIAMKGYVSVKDFKIEAGTQHTVTFTNTATKKTYTTYVNDGETVESYVFTRKGYTLAGYKNGSSTYNFSSPVKSNLNLTTNWTKTKGPAKPTITAKSSGKKKVKVTVKKAVKNAKGYQIQYSTKKNMKGAKKKATTKKTYTIKKLKSRKYVYVKVRAYTLDSTGSKVYGKFSAKKKVFVK